VLAEKGGGLCPLSCAVPSVVRARLCADSLRGIFRVAGPSGELGCTCDCTGADASTRLFCHEEDVFVECELILSVSAGAVVDVTEPDRPNDSRRGGVGGAVRTS